MNDDKLIANARNLQTTYHPNARIAHTLRDKSLVMFVAPVACGKTYIMNHITQLDTRFTRVPVFTTREARADDDPGMFRTIPHDESHINAIVNKIKAGDVVQYAVHPTSGRIYGSEVQDYPGEYNMLATLSGVVTQMTNLPFRQILIVGLVTPSDVWLSWFTKRYPAASEEKRKRLKEAAQSLRWLIDHTNQITWAENIKDNPAKTARTIIDAILYNKREDKQELAEELLRTVKEMQ